ncbi:GAF domain-containing protein [Desulfobacterales bacterium HSG2]|nr:GAF domain-containing protein [Desulfobacterales bacterium HSG2]
MNIKTKLRINTLFSVVVVIIVSLTLLSASQQVREAIDKHRMADQIGRAIFELATVANDYLAHHEKQASRQWQLKYDSLTGLITDRRFQETEEKYLLKNIQQHHESLKKTFSKLLANDENRSRDEREAQVAAELERRLAGQLAVTSQAMLSLVWQLAERSHAGVIKAQQRANWIVMLLIIIIAVIIAVSSFLLGISILRPIAELRKGTEIIGAGNLNYKVGTGAKDEIGQLSSAFDKMVKDLKSVMASRDELTKEVAERKKAEEETLRRGALLDAINRVFYEALTCETEEELGKTCLAAAEDLTNSKFGFISEINPRGLFDSISISDPGWKACKMSEAEAVASLSDMKIRGIYGHVIKKEESVIANAPGSHPARIGLPKGHPPLTSFLGTPLKRSGRIIGMIALGNKESGYDLKDQQALESLTVAFVIALDRKRAEEALKKREEELEKKTIELTNANKLIDAINRVFYEALISESEEELGKTCLAAAEELTNSKFGFINEINPAGRLDTMAISDPGWEACRIPKSEAMIKIFDIEIRGINGKVINDGQSLIANDPASHPAYIGLPEGHPPLTSYLGVPLKRGSSVIGIISLGNKDPGYDLKDQQAVESLATAFVEALDRKRAEEALREREDQLKKQTADLTNANEQMEQEIIRRMRTESDLYERTKELERSNRDLQQFAYVASHDLQEPLRSVSSYVQLLARRYRGRLDSDADEFIAFAVEGAKRMQELILDLLAYSRVGTHGEKLEPTDSATALTRALTNLQTAIEESGAAVTHESMPIVMADKSQLIQLFQNLIGNAVKFCGDNPEVHVAAERKRGEWIFSVRDNGIGIGSEYAERIFVIFQRLHTMDKYSGTGIGLAICKKIVDRHGGRLWVKSREGAGSTFYFTIPIEEENCYEDGNK